MHRHRASFAAATFLGLIGAILASGVHAERIDPRATSLINAKHTIAGTVLDSSGKPAGNIEVKLLKKQPANIVGPSIIPPGGNPTGDGEIGAPAPNRLQKSGGGSVARNETVVQHFKTDSAGRFNFANVEPGQYSVLAGLGKVAVRGDVAVNESDPPAMTLTLRSP